MQRQISQVAVRHQSRPDDSEDDKRKRRGRTFLPHPLPVVNSGQKNKAMWVKFYHGKGSFF